MAKPKKVTPGPYSTPFMTRREREREAQRTATDAVESTKVIEDRRRREAAAAAGITKSFGDILREQANAQASRLGAIQAAAGQNVGAGALAGSITGAVQAAEAAPRLSAGRGVELAADVEGRATTARKERAQDFRKYLTQSRADIEAGEREKQAAQIEGAATAKAYDLKEKDYQRGILESDRNYDLAFRELEAKLSENNTGDVNDLIPTFSSIFKESSKKKGTGLYQGEVTFTNGDTGKQEKVKVSGVDFNPANKTAAQRNQFWKKYIEQKTGKPVDGFPTRTVERGSTRVPPVEVFRDIFDSTMALGDFSRDEIYRALLRSPEGMMNTAAVREAYKGR
jgi:hypothetical protein